MSTPPSWFPEAVPTRLGWAHPLTGEQLTATKNLENPIDYYEPNAKAASFISPEETTVDQRTILNFVRNGRKVNFAVLSRDKILHVSWNFDDGSTLEDGPAVIHFYSDDGSYSVTAQVTVLIDGEEEVVDLAVDVLIGDVVPGVAPILDYVQIAGDQQIGSNHSLSLKVSNISSEEYTDISQWEIDGVVVSTSSTYQIQEEDEGKEIVARVIVSNNSGSDEHTTSIIIGSNVTPIMDQVYIDKYPEEDVLTISTIIFGSPQVNDYDENLIWSFQWYIGESPIENANADILSISEFPSGSTFYLEVTLENSEGTGSKLSFPYTKE